MNPKSYFKGLRELSISYFKFYRTAIIPKTIYYIRVSYLVDGKSDKMDKKKETFYFDRELTRIIAFK